MGQLLEVTVNTTPPERHVFFLVPDAIDDPERVSGGNVYDRRLRQGLGELGWEVTTMPVADAALAAEPTAHALSQLADGALVLIDGLLVAREPAALIHHRARLLVVVLAHMVAPVTPDLSDPERDALRGARHIVATSNWTRAELIAQDAADPRRIVVAHPGADPAPVTVASPSGGRLLCVGAVTPLKGHDVLIEALAELSDVDGWTLSIVGSLTVAPDHVTELRTAITSAGLDRRVEFRGVLTGDALEDAYGQADLVVMPSRVESYGMAVAEALAHGIPVLASGVGGISEAIAGSEAGMIVPSDDPWALAVVLRDWLSRPSRRRDLKAAALQARDAARPWNATSAAVSSVLAQTVDEQAPLGHGVPAARPHAGSASRS